jgi:hypothetical protein
MLKDFKKLGNDLKGALGDRLKSMGTGLANMGLDMLGG